MFKPPIKNKASEMNPLICIPMGDPAGIGAEIIVKALSSTDHNRNRNCKTIVVGDRQYIEEAARLCQLPVRISVYEGEIPASQSPGEILLLESPILKKLKKDDRKPIRFGEISASAGRAALQFIEQAVDFTMSHNNTVLVTPPINKESLRAARVPHIGHTEILASLTGTRNPITLFQVKNLRVFFLTRHLSLRQACDAISESRVYDGILRSCQVLTSLGLPKPKLAVAGLNPHCGENGLFGDEEVCAIRPAVLRAKSSGLDVTGPVPADSVFHQALQGTFDGVLSLYHDQGHIATKMVDFERTVSITCGLPFLRTSVDHGTAYDIAGTGQASAVSLSEAIRMASCYSTPDHLGSLPG